jgi:hypothetical protein
MLLANFIYGILDGGDLTVYIMAKKDKRDKKFEVRHKEIDGSSYMISCYCRKLEWLGTLCSHICTCWEEKSKAIAQVLCSRQVDDERKVYLSFEQKD